MKRNHLQERLKELRMGRGLTQQQLSEMMNVTRTTVSNWERGTRIPDLESLENLAKFYKVSLDTFGTEGTQDDIYDLLIRAKRIFRNPKLSIEDKTELHQELLKVYLELKGAEHK